MTIGILMGGIAGRSLLRMNDYSVLTERESRTWPSSARNGPYIYMDDFGILSSGLLGMGGERLGVFVGST